MVRTRIKENNGFILVKTPSVNSGIFINQFLEVFMKNTIKVLGIIALVALIGFSFAACKDDTEDTEDTSGGGTFILTDIPETYNGKYARFEAQDAGNSIYVKGVKSYNDNTGKTILVKISNGKANFSMFWSKPYTYGSYKYYGNDTFIIGTDTIQVFVFNNETDTWSSSSFYFSENFREPSKNELVFKNGSLEKSANDGYWVDF